MAAAVPYIAAAAVGALVADQQKPVNPPSVTPPPPPPQAAQAPNVQGIVQGMNGTGQSGDKAGPGQTFLAGSSGVDPNQLKLGKPTLLGE